MDNDDETSLPMIDDISGIGDENHRRKMIITGEQLDVEAYASLYSGRSKIKQLIFIAQRCDNCTMQIEAVRMVYDEIKKGEDVQLLKEVSQSINCRLGNDYELDCVWIESVERRAEHRKEKLQNELNDYRQI